MPLNPSAETRFQWRNVAATFSELPSARCIVNMLLKRRAFNCHEKVALFSFAHDGRQLYQVEQAKSAEQMAPLGLDIPD